MAFDHHPTEMWAREAARLQELSEHRRGLPSPHSARTELLVGALGMLSLFGCAAVIVLIILGVIPV